MKYLWIALGMLAISFQANAADAMKTVASKHSFQETQSRLESVLKEKGFTIFATIDHTAGAEKIGLKMQPETVTIFGNPKGGTPFMVASPEAAIDFPMKALVWQDASGKVFLSYNTIASVAKRHHIKGQAALVKKVDGAQAAIAKAVTE